MPHIIFFIKYCRFAQSIFDFFFIHKQIVVPTIHSHIQMSHDTRTSLKYYYRLLERSYIFLLTKVSFTYCAKIVLYFCFIKSFVTITLTASKKYFRKISHNCKTIISFHRANTIKLILKWKKWWVHSDKPADRFIP